MNQFRKLLVLIDGQLEGARKIFKIKAFYRLPFKGLILKKEEE